MLTGDPSLPNSLMNSRSPYRREDCRTICGIVSYLGMSLSGPPGMFSIVYHPQAKV